MSKPAILTVDDDPRGSARIRRDVRLPWMQRVASAAGEAAVPVYPLHRYLATV